MKRIKIGIIGQGRSGHNIHVKSLSQMREMFEIAAVCDEIEERTADGRTMGADAYTNYKELLKRDDLDLVVNSSPSHLHVPITKEAFAAGHNVLCEKPLARTASEVDELIKTAGEKGLFFAVYQQSRFAPYFAQVKKVIDSGVLGRIIIIKAAANGFSRRWDWQTLQENNGGNLLNTGPHPMDQVLQLFGSDVMPEVFCVMDTVNTYGDAEDFVKVVLRGEGRPMIDLEISSCDAYPRYSYHVQGQYGGLIGDRDHIEWRYYDPSKAPDQRLLREPLEGRRYCSEDLVFTEESWDVPSEQTDLFHTMAGKFYSNLYSAMTKGEPLAVTLGQVRQQIAVIEECHRQCPLPRLGA